MVSRHHRLSRVSKALDNVWRHQTGQVVVIDNRLKELDRLESTLVDRLNPNVPYQLVISRICYIHQQRISLTEQKSMALIKARATGLQLKRIGHLLSTPDP